MARIARVVIPGLVHHVTQRGNHRQTVFLEERDRQVYLDLLRDWLLLHSVCLVGYCLMGNHVHLMPIPGSPFGHRQISESVACPRICRTTCLA
jgi:putative transposase